MAAYFRNLDKNLGLLFLIISMCIAAPAILSNQSKLFLFNESVSLQETAMHIALALTLIHILRPSSPVFLGILGVCAVAIVGNYIATLFWLIALVAGSFSIGRLVYKNSNFPAVQTLVGLAILGLVVNYGHTHITISSLTTQVTLVMICLIDREHLFLIARELAAKIVPSNETRFRVTSYIDIALISFLLLFVLISLLPEQGSDALITNLSIPKQLATYGTFDQQLIYECCRPRLGPSIHGIGFILAGESGSRLINIIALLLIAKLSSDILGIWLKDPAIATRIALLLIFTSPFILHHTTTVQFELLGTSFLLGTLLCSIRLFSFSEGRSNIIALAICLVGLMQTKYAVALTFLGVVPLLVAAALYRSRILMRDLPYVLTGCIICGALVVPYYIHYVIDLLPQFDSQETSEAPARIFGPRQIFDPGYIFDITFHTNEFIEGLPGAAGFQWMILLPGALTTLLFSKNRRPLLILAPVIITLVVINQQSANLRYLSPPLTVLSVCMAFAMHELFFRGKLAKGVVTTSLSVTVLCNFLAIGNASYYDARLSKDYLFGTAGDRQKFINRNFPEKMAANLLQVHNPDNWSALLVGNDHLNHFAPLTYYYGTLRAQGFRSELVDAIDNSSSLEDLSGALLKRKILWLIVKKEGAQQEGKIQNLLDISQKSSETDHYEIRKIKKKYRRITEDHTGNISSDYGWTFHGSPDFSKDGKVGLTVSSNAFRYFDVSPGASVKITMTFDCFETSTLVRRQIIWSDKSGDKTDAYIDLVDCNNKLHVDEFEVDVPIWATQLQLFATPHGETPVYFHELKLQ